MLEDKFINEFYWDNKFFKCFEIFNIQRTMEIKLILKNTSKLFSTKLFQFLTGLVKAKLNAIFLELPE